MLKHQLPPTAAVMLGLTLFSSLAGAADWELLPSRSNDVELSIEGGVVDVRTTGSDPFLVGRWVGKREAHDRVLEFEYFCSQEIDSLSAFFGPPISEANRMDMPDLPLAEGWQTYSFDVQSMLGKPLPLTATLFRIDVGTTANRRLQIRNVQLRPLSEKEIHEQATREANRKQKREAAARIAGYLQESFPLALHVQVEAQSVIVSCAAPREVDPATSCQLVEYLPQESIADRDAGIVCDDVQVVQNENLWTLQLPRYELGRDRLHSGWRLRSRESGSYLSARHFATSIALASPDHAQSRPQPKSQKGLSGFSRRGPQQDLIDLGIHSVTINLVLNQFVSNAPAAGRTPINAPGPPVYFDANIFAGYDQLLDFARQHQIVVSAIVLIPRSKRASALSPLVHPQADGGVYAMPDISTPRGVSIYHHVLDAIAQRYRNSDVAPGGITNWIAHNEVDFHPVWTNMGKQPRELFTETYYRSLRMIHNAARSHNPHARVFASLTHHWTVPDDGKWNRLAPREFLQTLQRYSDREGDFAWGVAYHPYPQSLFADVAWHDTNVSDNFDTPLITMQNLEVLGRYLEQPAMRDAAGKVRPVLLSEQGYHTDSYDDDSQARQAGSLFYAMNKVRQLPFVESFLYHRWIDHRDEGGLMLGLRTLPSRQHPHGERKRAWYLYQAIGTERETEASEGLPQPSPEP